MCSGEQEMFLEAMVDIIYILADLIIANNSFFRQAQTQNSINKTFKSLVF